MSEQSPVKRSDRHRAVDYKYQTSGLREGSLSRETWPNFSSFFSHAFIGSFIHSMGW